MSSIKDFINYIIHGEELMHYGKGHLDGGHSGRYPWGSGKNPEQRSNSFLKYVNEQRKKGLSLQEIAEGMGKSENRKITQTELKQRISIARMYERKAIRDKIISLTSEGKGATEIGRILGMNESSVRSYLNDKLDANSEKTRNTAMAIENTLKKAKQPIDVGKGAELYLGVTRTKMDTALQLLKSEGYNVYSIDVDQIQSPGHKTHMQILAPKEMSWTDTMKMAQNGKISLCDSAFHTEDNGKTFFGIETPASISSDRVFINYGETGGKEKDGMVELRRGVPDLSLGESKYCQVRIAVDGDKYMKGMAIYSDNVPKGYDVIYNTNKPYGTPKEKVFKSMKDDPDNPFGAVIKANGQSHYIDKDGKTKLSAINKIKDEGDWESQSRNLAAQFLSKQSVGLAKQQLDLDYNMRKDDFKEILSYNNPSVKKKLLQSFADNCDSAANELKAAALPRQAWYAILPVPSLRDGEIYAPRYKDGETVVLIRYPHGGTFEIPELKVNNNNREGKRLLGGDAVDAVGINFKTAQQLSGADFDGDTVLVIPNNDKKIRSTKPLKALENFDPSEAYPGYPGMKVCSEQNKQKMMGVISNLITDMTIKGAVSNEDELARAVKHSMVVIDCVKHELDYKKSYEENGISELIRKYQMNPTTGHAGGASTIISRASSEIRVDERKERGIDPETGSIRYVPTYREYKDPKTGKIVVAKEKTTKMDVVKNAYELTSGYPGTTTKMESTYADYANQLKALANEARLQSISFEAKPYSPSAARVYSREVNSLKEKLSNSESNAPRERMAQVYANAVYRSKKLDNPNMTDEDKKKVKQQALATGRVRYQAKKAKVDITESEWNAIQSGALSPTLVDRILNNADLDQIKTYALPKSKANIGLSSAKQARILSLLNNGYTIADVAAQFGVSTSTISRIKAESRGDT